MFCVYVVMFLFDFVLVSFCCFYTHYCVVFIVVCLSLSIVYVVCFFSWLALAFAHASPVGFSFVFSRCGF